MDTLFEIPTYSINTQTRTDLVPDRNGGGGWRGGGGVKKITENSNNGKQKRNLLLRSLRHRTAHNLMYQNKTNKDKYKIKQHESCGIVPSFVWRGNGK